MNLELFKDVLTDLIKLVLLYFVFRVFWGNETWYHDQLKELVFAIVSTLLFLLLSIVKQPFSRPIKLSITQKNSQYGRSETTFSIKGKRVTQEHERTISVEVTVKRRSSVLGTMVLRYIRKRNLGILIRSATSGLVLQAEQEQIRNDIESTDTGFHVKVGPYIKDILDRTDSGTFKKGCKYVINADPNFRVTDESFQIRPVLISDTGSSPFWVPLLLQFQYEDHAVHFTHE